MSGAGYAGGPGRPRGGQQDQSGAPEDEIVRPRYMLRRTEMLAAEVRMREAGHLPEDVSLEDLFNQCDKLIGSLNLGDKDVQGSLYTVVARELDNILENFMPPALPELPEDASIEERAAARPPLSEESDQSSKVLVWGRRFGLPDTSFSIVNSMSGEEIESCFPEDFVSTGITTLRNETNGITLTLIDNLDLHYLENWGVTRWDPERNQPLLARLIEFIGFRNPGSL